MERQSRDRLHAAPTNHLLHLIGNVHHLPSLLRFKRQILRKALHSISISFSIALSTHSAFILITAVNESNRQAAEQLSQQGMNLLAEGLPIEAERAFRAAIAADAANYEAHHGLIRALRDAGRLEQSIGAALALTALTPMTLCTYDAIYLVAIRRTIPKRSSIRAARVVEWKLQLKSPPDQSSAEKDPRL